MVRRFTNPSTIQILKKLLPPQPTAASNRYRRGPRRYLSATLTPGVRVKGPLLAIPDAVGHDVMSLTPWLTATDVYFCKICDRTYIFAKFVTDHIFLQNCDKINI
jgi:hypothetical protein